MPRPLRVRIDPAAASVESQTDGSGRLVIDADRAAHWQGAGSRLNPARSQTSLRESARRLAQAAQALRLGQAP